MRFRSDPTNKVSRILARKDGARVRLWTRQAVDCTGHFPRIAVAAPPVDACNRARWQVTGDSDLSLRF